MGLIYAKNLKHAKRKLSNFKNLTAKERKRYSIKRSRLKSEEKGYNIYVVRKK